MAHLSNAELRDLNGLTRADVVLNSEPHDVPVLTLRYGTHQCHG